MKGRWARLLPWAGSRDEDIHELCTWGAALGSAGLGKGKYQAGLGKQIISVGASKAAFRDTLLLTQPQGRPTEKSGPGSEEEDDGAAEDMKCVASGGFLLTFPDRASEPLKCGMGS